MRLGESHGNRLETGRLSLHEDAPEFTIPITVRSAPSRRAYSEVVQRLLAHKNLRPTREAVAVLRALTGSLWDVARSLAGLSPETSREIGLDEVRYGLSTLPAERILPAQPPTVGRIVHALLGVGRPCRRGEVAELADVSTQSIRNHVETLESLGLLEETASGLRVAIPFTAERHEARNILPFYIRQNRPLAAVLYEIAQRHGGLISERVNDLDDAAGEALVYPPDFAQFMRAVPWLGPWVSVLRGACGAPAAAGSTTVRLGPQPSQVPITGSTVAMGVGD